MSYYCFNREELLQKTKDKYHNCCDKEKAAEYYITNKEVLKKKKKSKNMYRNFSGEGKEKKKNMERIDIKT